MKNRGGGVGADGGEDSFAIADIARDLPDARVGDGTMEDGVEEHDLANFLRRTGGARERTALQELLAELEAEEAASAGDDDFDG